MIIGLLYAGTVYEIIYLAQCVLVTVEYVNHYSRMSCTCFENIPRYLISY